MATVRTGGGPGPDSSPYCQYGLVVMGTFMRDFWSIRITDAWTLAEMANGAGQREFHQSHGQLPRHLDCLRRFLAGRMASAPPSLTSSSATRFLLARGLLDFLVWLPSTLPGIVLVLGYLWLFLGTPWPSPYLRNDLHPCPGRHARQHHADNTDIKANLLQLGRRARRGFLGKRCFMVVRISPCHSAFDCTSDCRGRRTGLCLGGRVHEPCGTPGDAGKSTAVNSPAQPSLPQ